MDVKQFLVVGLVGSFIVGDKNLSSTQPDGAVAPYISMRQSSGGSGALRTSPVSSLASLV